MRRVLLTGMSGTGKSTLVLVQELRARGYKAVDVGEPGWSEYDAEGDWVWREERIRELLAEDDADLLFISGCATNQVKFYEHFDHVILLSAPPEVLLERLSSRSTNSYGKSPMERADVLRYVRTVEPQLRRTAGHEIETTVSVDEVVAILLQLVSA